VGFCGGYVYARWSAMGRYDGGADVYRVCAAGRAEV